MILGANLCTKAPGKSIEFGQTRSEIKRSAIIFPPFLPSSYVGLSENRAPPLVNHQISLSKIAILKDNNPI